MKGPLRKDREPKLAAGGIVVRGDKEPRVAVVRLRKDKAWVLPKGKLKPKEDALAAAKREVIEETGHDVRVHEFLGSMSHEAGAGNLKVVRFWRMEAISDKPVHPLMRDVRAVLWLPLDEAVKKLTHSREQVFLANVGPDAIKAVNRPRGKRPIAAPAQPSLDDFTSAKSGRTRLADRVRSWVRRISLVQTHKR
jgi:8-oxo-dGTP diphosphatase